MEIYNNVNTTQYHASLEMFWGNFLCNEIKLAIRGIVIYSVELLFKDIYNI